VTYYQPLILVFLLMILIGLLGLRKSRGVWMPALGLLGLCLVSFPAADWLFSRPLESPYPVRPLFSESGQAIVVLSGTVAPPQYPAPYTLPDRETNERCRYAAWLYAHWRPLPVLASGGTDSPGARPFSDTMRELLNREGVPESMIWTETRSRSTHENAVYSAELLRSKGIDKIVLVTEAQSMLRAELSFRKEGLVVIPAPSEFREFEALDDELIPSWKAIYRNEITLHETLGLAWYRLRGWI
jgi:uncharacterized SAM-binding protein YcdF (DUF218 family)